MKRILSLLPLFLLAACQPPVNHNTMSGRPEACIAAKQQRVSAGLAEILLNKGFSVSQQTDSMVRGDRAITDAMASMFFGSQYDSTPVARITYNIVNTQKCVRVVADMNIVTNPGSAFERLTPMNNSKDSATIQSEMDALKASLEPHTKKRK